MRRLSLASPQVRVRGTVRLPSGDVNLVATQLALDRDHANLVTFAPDQSPGLDPLVDLVMTGGDLRVAIQVGEVGAQGRPSNPLQSNPADHRMPTT